MSTPTMGRQMASEMAEQPDVLRQLAERFAAITQDVRSVAGRNPRGVAFLARGSSDNAALLGRYAVELYSGLPTCLVAPSVMTTYGRTPSGFAGWLLVALSQSGRTPEIVTLAHQFRQAGAGVVAVTNEASSELADVADFTIALNAGVERAVPATKTVTSQMLAALAIASGLSSDGLTPAQASEMPDAVAALLADTTGVREIGDSIARHDRLAVVGRAVCYPAALESALKLQETTGIMAQGFSSADFRHGPIAVCGPDSPAVLLAGSGPADSGTRDLAVELKARHAPVFTIGTGPSVDAAWRALGNPAEAILATVRGQQLAHALAAARGVDPDAPAGLNKVTLTH
jgi:glucosamine--fructose-6-phosphate aminotransferase (isomerizing)